MENAVKALLMAAGVLIGVMIISLGVNLYSSLNVYVEDMNEEIINTEISQFNEKFLKFINYNRGVEQYTLTIQDVVTAANIAFENNRNNDGTYVAVKLNGTNLETTINNNSAKLLNDGLGKKYKCTLQDVKIDPITDKVYEVNFYEN